MDMRAPIDFNEVPISEFCIEVVAELPSDPKIGRIVLLTSEIPDKLCVFTDSGWKYPNVLVAGTTSGTVCAGDDPRLNPSVELLTGTTVLSDQRIVLINSGSDCNVFLPIGTDNKIYRLRNIGAGRVTLIPNGTDLVEFQSSFLVQTLNAFDLVFFSNNWYVL